MQPRPNNPFAALYPAEVNPDLKYLFVAEFADGSQIAQTPEDQSMADPAKPAFWDVQAYAAKVPISRFHLTDGNMWYTVDLRDGSFEVNGVPFESFDPYNNPYIKLHGPLRLIYYPHTDTVSVVDQNSPHKIIDYKHRATRYFLGWQFTKDGKNYQQTIAIR